MRRLTRTAIPLLGTLMLACGGGGESEAPPLVAGAPSPAAVEADASQLAETMIEEGVASLSGRILLDDDLDPRGFSVSLHEVTPENRKSPLGEMEFVGEDGTFLFTMLSPGQKRLVIDAAEPATADSPRTPGPALIGSVEQSLEVVLGEVRQVEIDLRPHRPCPAQVTVRAGEKPAAGLNVLWRLPSGELGLVGITDGEGVAIGWCPPAEELAIVASSRTGLVLEVEPWPTGLAPGESHRSELQVAGGTITLVVPEGFTLGAGEQIRARLLPPGVDLESSSDALIWSAKLFDEFPRGRDQAYLLRGRACDLGLVPPGQLRIEAIVDDPETGFPGRPWPEDARRFEGETTIVAGMRSVCALREK